MIIVDSLSNLTNDSEIPLGDHFSSSSLLDIRWKRLARLYKVTVVIVSSATISIKIPCDIHLECHASPETTIMPLSESSPNTSRQSKTLQVALLQHPLQLTVPTDSTQSKNKTNHPSSGRKQKNPRITLMHTPLGLTTPASD